MLTTPSLQRFGLCAVLAGIAALSASAAMAQAQAPNPATLELLASRGNLSAGLPDQQALNMRGTWLLSGSDVARLELLDEKKFDSRGGVVAASYTKVLSPDWLTTGTLALGHGGVNWANVRGDLEFARKWGAQRNWITRAALYHASFDGNRSDKGLRLGVAAYLPSAVVLEAGITFNISDPGAVHSRMPFVSATYGHEGVQYISLRLASGSEAYQPLAAGLQLVDFDSHSLALNWRRWLGPRWGVSAQAEHYKNPSYHRNTLGAGLFVQW